jgi:hypothetical protein
LNCDILKTILKRAAHEDKEERREERGKKIKKKTNLERTPNF